MNNIKSCIYAELSIASHVPTRGSPVPTTPHPGFNIPVSQPDQERFGSFPQFLSVHQLVDVLEGSTAVLECRLANLDIQHMVGFDWMQKNILASIFYSDNLCGYCSQTFLSTSVFFCLSYIKYSEKLLEVILSFGMHTKKKFFTAHTGFLIGLTC